MENKNMITLNELEEYAKRIRLNLGQAEIDYFQNILLFIINQDYGNEVLFKGGTALKKCYGLDRFSEDLDFNCHSEINIHKIDLGLKRFNIDYTIKTESYDRGIKITLRIKGPLYNGLANSTCKLIIDFSFREKNILAPEIKKIGRYLEEIPSFDIIVMQEMEIASEKIRAITTRNKARDLYDLAFLIDKGVFIDTHLVKNKLKYYKEEWNKKLFIKKLDEKEKIWISELKPLIDKVPKFSEIKRDILKSINGLN